MAKCFCSYTLAFLFITFVLANAGDAPVRMEKVSTFYVIGKMGEGSIEKKDEWIPPLWAAASGNFKEIADYIKRTATGLPSGVWAIMSDRSESFKPWDARGGKYLAGFESIDDSPAPEGWTKWRVPGDEYIVIETSLADYQEVFTHALRTLLPEKGLTLAGAVHEHYPLPEDPTVVELYFPVQRLAESNIER